MDKTELVRAIAQAYGYWRLDKLPSEQQITLWLSQLEHIPGAALNWILPDLYQEHDNLPRNLPKAIKEAYAKAPIESRKHIVKVHCDQCNGNGHFRIRYEDSMKQMVWGVAICKACDNWRVDFGKNSYDIMLKSYPRQAELAGYEVKLCGRPESLIDQKTNSDEIPF
jgi:hypothetical protein